jgi:hypothetical protein
MPSENTVKVRITKPHPETGETLKYYENSYLWNEQFHTLVAFDCFDKEIEIPTEVEDECAKSIDVASKVIDVMVSGDIKDSETANLPKVAECIKSKIVEYTSTETEECLIKVIV